MMLGAREKDDRPVLKQGDLELLHHISGGLTDQQIALKLRVSVHTIHKRVRLVLWKTKSASRTEAAIKAIKSGLLVSMLVTSVGPESVSGEVVG